MKNILFMQNGRVAARKPKERSEKKHKRLRRKIFKIIFQGIEALWMLLQIVQYLLQILK